MFSRLAQSTSSFFRSVSREPVSDNESAQEQQSIKPEHSSQGMIITGSQSQNFAETSSYGALATSNDVLDLENKERDNNPPRSIGEKVELSVPKLSQGSSKELGSNETESVVLDSQPELDTQRLVLRLHDAQEGVSEGRAASIPSDLESIHGSQVVNETQEPEAHARPLVGNCGSLGAEDEMENGIHNGAEDTLGSSINFREANQIQESTTGTEDNHIKAAKMTMMGELSPIENATAPQGLSHKMFGSMDLAVPETQLVPDSQQSDIKSDNPESLNPANDNEEDSDEAPEMMTAAKGQNQSRLAAAEEAKAVQKQAHATKEKRRKRDAHLKEQAKLAKKKKSNAKVASLPSLPTKSAEQPTSFDAGSIRENGTLPDLLPEELLAEDSPPPTPILPAKFQPKASLSKKRKFIDPDPKPPKDIWRGDKVFRTLQTARTALPPKSSKASKSIKECWLNGERGRGDSSVASKRRKVGGGFLRR